MGFLLGMGEEVEEEDLESVESSRPSFWLIFIVFCYCFSKFNFLR